MSAANQAVRSVSAARPVLLALLLAALFTLCGFRLIDLRTDMTEFLPAGRTEAAKVMMQQLRSGAATSLILIGIDGPNPTELARVSHAMGELLTRSGQFALVANSETAF